jgi:hypothetical protein
MVEREKNFYLVRARDLLREKGEKIKFQEKEGVKLNIVLFFDPTLNPKRYEPLRQYYSQQH